MIKYILLSCERFLKTRVQWQRDSWISTVPSTYVYLTGNIQTDDPNVACMKTDDGYESCPKRYYQFIRENDLLEDWIVFADDDTFIFTDRLEDYLSRLNATRSLYIGRGLTHLPIYYMSGGAGFVLSKTAYTALRHYLLETPIETVMFDRHGDVSMGLWLKKVQGLEYLNSTLFNCCTHTHNECSNMDLAISYHYVTEDLFRLYGEINKVEHGGLGY